MNKEFWIYGFVFLAAMSLNAQGIQPVSSENVGGGVPSGSVPFVEILRQAEAGDTHAQFSVADAYLFTVVNWGGHVGIALEPWPRLQAFMSRVAARDSVQQAMRAEGLVQ